MMTWAATEFGAAQLGDARLTARLVRLGAALGERPTASIPQACGSWAATKAAYRFFDNEQVTPAQILASHQPATAARMAEHAIVLAVQDTTELDYSDHPATAGLGPLSTEACQGELVHTTLAVTPERVPLGVIDQQVWIRDGLGKRAARRQRPIEQKESYKWIRSLQATARWQAQLPHTRVVNVGDREADVYELFVEAQRLKTDLLVRVAHNRGVQEEAGYLWKHMAQQRVAKKVTIAVPRNDAQPAREAVLSIRYSPVLLRPPRHRPAGTPALPAVPLWVVWAQEEHPPRGVEAISWMLFTTVPVHSVADALERLQWYTGRWSIELYHKILKSGCHLEERQLETGDRLQRCLAVYAVIAWRVLYLTMLGRDRPKLSCAAVLETPEWQALYCFIHQTNEPPREPPTLGEATRWIGRLGGFLGRKWDGDPGIVVLWRGLQRLADIAAAWRTFCPPPRKRCG